MTFITKTLLILGLAALNAFFVAAEYSLLGVRRSRIEQLAREGDSRARLVQTLVNDMGLLFSGTQLGITVASVLMGWLGENVLASAIEAALQGSLPVRLTLTLAHSLAVALAFLLVTALLMVMGELVPKTLAYEKAERVALLVARPMIVFFKLSRIPVRLLDGLADNVMRALGHSPSQAHGMPYTPEEVMVIVS